MTREIWMCLNMSKLNLFILIRYHLVFSVLLCTIDNLSTFIIYLYALLINKITMIKINSSKFLWLVCLSSCLEANKGIYVICRTLENWTKSNQWSPLILLTCGWNQIKPLVVTVVQNESKPLFSFFHYLPQKLIFQIN